jgi:2-polyprenyl-3-methyl-5-hydroxy-6-metoxy-1,4-benzoquinol methylase
MIERMTMESKTVSVTRVLNRLRNRYGRQSLFRHLRDLIRPNHSTFIVENAESVTDFWELAHKDKSHPWLSGTPPLEVFERLKIQDHLKIGNRSILNVGVGEGYCTYALSKQGNTVDALDISSNALANVANFTEYQFLDAANLDAKKYDLILHHLVSQHMSHVNLSAQLSHLIRSQKVDGILALQFVSSSKNEMFVTEDDDISAQMHGGVFRSTQFLDEMIKGCGGRLINVFKTESWENSEAVFHTVHVQR